MTVYTSRHARGWRRLFRQTTNPTVIQDLTDQVRIAEGDRDAAIRDHDLIQAQLTRMAADLGQARSIAVRLEQENGDYERRMTDARRLLLAATWSEKQTWVALTAAEVDVVLSLLAVDGEVSLNELLEAGP